MNNFAGVQERVNDFAAERDWKQYHDPKNLIMALSTELGELNALFRWVANGDSDAAASLEPLRQAMKEEIGDIGILLLLLCTRVRVDLLDAISSKLEINARKYPAGKARGRAERPDK